MEKSGLLVARQNLKVVLRSAGMRPGALCVMTFGLDLMHKWPADSLDTQQQVRHAAKCLLTSERFQ